MSVVLKFSQAGETFGPWFNGIFVDVETNLWRFVTEHMLAFALVNHAPDGVFFIYICFESISTQVLESIKCEV